MGERRLTVEFSEPYFSSGEESNLLQVRNSLELVDKGITMRTIGKAFFGAAILSMASPAVCNSRFRQPLQ